MGRVPRDFHMLFLVMANRHDIGVIKQNVGRHEKWIIKNPDAYFLVFGLGVLKSVCAHEIRHCGDAVENPSQFGVSRHC